MRVHSFRESSSFFQIRLRRFAPKHIGIRRVRYATRDGRIEASTYAEEAFAGAFAGKERMIARINVAGQKVCAVRVGAGEYERRHAITSAASRAATSFWIASEVDTSTLPPRCPHFFAEESWSSKWTHAAPASIIAFISSKALRFPPKPASASAISGANQFTPFFPSA